LGVRHKLLGFSKWTAPVLFLLLAATSWSAPLPRPTWFPLQAGNQWTLTATNGATRTIELDSTPDGLLSATGLFDESVELRGDLNLQARLAGRPWQTVARFGRKEDRPWRFDLTGDNCGDTRAWWTASNAMLVTPAATFTGCRRWHSVRLNDTANACPPAATADLWLAPDVGPVGLLTGSGDWLWLTAATVGDRVYPPPTNGLVAQLTTDQSVYTNISDHLVICPPCTTNVPPCEVPCYFAGGTNATAKFTFQITNGTTQSQVFTFPTGQTFDIQLIDSNGVVVALWSTGKAFPTFVLTLALPSNQSLTYHAEMDMVDSTGRPLSGSYTARAYLTNSVGPTGVEATVPFRVVYELVPAVTTIQPTTQ
jgi:hypothetical protein